MPKTNKTKDLSDMELNLYVGVTKKEMVECNVWLTYLNKHLESVKSNLTRMGVSPGSIPKKLDEARKRLAQAPSNVNIMMKIEDAYDLKLPICEPLRLSLNVVEEDLRNSDDEDVVSEDESKRILSERVTGSPMASSNKPTRIPYKNV